LPVALNNIAKNITSLLINDNLGAAASHGNKEDELKKVEIIELMRRNHLSVFAARLKHAFQICFATLVW
jgi:hypothetical protein